MKYNTFSKAEILWFVLVNLIPLLAYHFYVNLGLSVLVFSLVTIWLCSVFILCQTINKRTKTLSYALKAFLNEDPTFLLEKKHPLSEQFNEMYQKLNQSKFKAAEKANYLSAIMVHLDTALLIVDAFDRVIQSNPKSKQLIGNVGKITPALGQFAEFIIASRATRRGVVTVTLGSSSDSFSVQVSCTQIDGKALKLITFQSINQALTSREYQAYNGLTKVITHEVLNSITPMKSLSQTALNILEQEQTPIEIERLKFAMEKIVSRSTQLTSFIESFKLISSLPKLLLKPTSISKLVKNIISLHEGIIEQEGVEIVFHDKANYTCLLDPVQIDLCIMNVLKNAIYAASKSDVKKINIHLYEDDRAQLLMDIEDFGLGIEEHVVEHIFIPFFSTKSDGSGIGLSLSKQIMNAHGGDLLYVEKPQKGALFRIIFP
jgi:nitrogen fixation/metabolism regulation signal transduction histidine kinase